MCDLISDVITFWEWSCDTGKINTSDKIMLEKNQKQGESLEIKETFT